MSIDEYYKTLAFALGKNVNARKKLYLDTKYWIFFRDAELGISENRTIYELLSAIRYYVKKGVLICPISSDIFSEVMKQSIEKSFEASVALIDELSMGVSVLSWKERLNIELLYFIRSRTQGESNCYSTCELVWTKLSYVLGIMNPINTVFSESQELIIQKGFLDHMWKSSLSDLVNAIGVNAIRNIPHIPDFSHTLNEGKSDHIYENDNIKELYFSEIAGVLDSMMSELKEVSVYFYEQSLGKSATTEEIENSRVDQKLANAIYQAFVNDKISNELPIVQIPAALHAMIRWDKRRKYHRNDLHDIGHAETALPYYDIFFTENSLRDLVQRSNFKLDRMYECQVISHPNDGLDVINDVMNET